MRLFTSLRAAITAGAFFPRTKAAVRRDPGQRPTMSPDVHPRVPVDRSPWLAIAVVAGLHFAVNLPFITHLRNLCDYDEGVHLALAREVAHSARLYTDVGFIHTPFLIWLAAAVYRMTASWTAVRMAYIGLGALVVPPLYLLARTIVGQRGAFIACLVYLTSPAVCEVLTRRVYTDVPAVVCQTWALFLLFGTEKPRPAAFVAAGAVLGVGVGFRLAATFSLLAIGIGLLAGYGRRSWRWLYALTLGFVAVVIPLFVVLLRIDGCLYCLSVLPFGGVRASVGLRVWKTLHLLPAAPLIMLYGWRIVTSGREEPRLRALAATSCALLVLSILPYTSFFPRYLLPVFPLAAIGVSLAYQRLFALQRPDKRDRSSWWRQRLGRLCFFLVSAGQACGLVYAVLIRQPRPPGQDQLLRTLTKGTGFLYTGDPAWAVESGRALVPGYYRCDSRAPQLVHAIGPPDFDRNLDVAQTVLLDHGLAGDFQAANYAHLRANFRLVFQTEHWQLWEHKSASQQAATPKVR